MCQNFDDDIFGVAFQGVQEARGKMPPTATAQNDEMNVNDIETTDNSVEFYERSSQWQTIHLMSILSQ